MAQDQNSWNGTGRAIKNAVLKYLNNGTAVCEFTLATNYYNGADKPEGVNYIDFIMYGKRAESIAKHIIQGNQYIITGNLRQERWTDNSGEQKSRIRIYVENFSFGAVKKVQEENRSNNSNNNSNNNYDSRKSSENNNYNYTDQKPTTNPDGTSNFGNTTSDPDEVPF